MVRAVTFPACLSLALKLSLFVSDLAALSLFGAALSLCHFLAFVQADQIDRPVTHRRGKRKRRPFGPPFLSRSQRKGNCR